MTWIEAINRVLDDEHDALHYLEIARLIKERGYRDKLGATPGNTVNANIGDDIRANGEKSVYVRRERGMYALRAHMADIEAREEAEEAEEQRYEEVIGAFGIAWNREKVIWNTSPDLFGVQSDGADPVNFKEQIGVYLLYDGREVIYAGQAIRQTLGERISQHTKDRLSGRWDRFSWFGLYSVSDDGTLQKDHETHRTISIATIGNTLEALLIEGIEPRQNRKQGDVFNTKEYNQLEDPKIARKKGQAFLESLKDRL